MRATRSLGPLALCLFCLLLLLSACKEETKDVVQVTKEGPELKWAIPGIYVGGTMVDYTEEVYLRYLPRNMLFSADSGRFADFADLSIEFTAPFADGELPWRALPPNKIAVSFFGFDENSEYENRKFELILASAFSALRNTRSDNPPFPAGFTVSDTLTDYFAILWSKTKTLSGYQNGEFDDLAVYLNPPVFHCIFVNASCNGLYITPNSIVLGGEEPIACHEFVHYLLWRNTGDPDSDHKSSLFGKCPILF